MNCIVINHRWTLKQSECSLGRKVDVASLRTFYVSTIPRILAVLIIITCVPLRFVSQTAEPASGKGNYNRRLHGLSLADTFGRVCHPLLIFLILCLTVSTN